MKSSICALMALCSIASVEAGSKTVTHFRCEAPSLSRESFEFRILNLDNLEHAKFVHYDVEGELLDVSTFDKNGKNTTSTFAGDFGCFNGQGYSNGPGVSTDASGNAAMVLNGDCDGFTYFTLKLFEDSGFQKGYLTDTGSERKGYWKVSCEVTEE